MEKAELKKLYEATKLTRPYRRAWILIIVALVGSIAWLAVSFHVVKTLENKSSQLEERSAQLDKEINLKKKEYEAVEQQLKDKQRLIETLAPLLDLTPLVISEPMRAARSKIKVQYVSRDIKPESLAVIKQFGFEPEDKRPPNDTPTSNTIWFGKNVSTDDVKLVAYILVRHDFKLNDIKLFPKSSGSENVIQVGALGKSKSKSYLTLEQIAEKKTFTDVDVSWLSGIWAGQATQIVTGENQGGNTGQWTITLTVQNGKYAVDYPSLSCGGKWTLLRKSAKTIRFKERITYGERCVDNGFVTIEKRGSSQILFNYINPDGAGVTSFAILTKQ